MSGRGNAALPGVRGDVAVDIHHGHLPSLLLRVSSDQTGQRLGCAFARFHHRQAKRAIGNFNKGLGGDSADAGLHPRYGACLLYTSRCV